jgi:hypothetical protein
MATRRRRTHGKAVEEEGGTVKGVRDEARSDILSDLRDGVARAQQGVDLLRMLEVISTGSCCIRPCSCAHLST